MFHLTHGACLMIVDKGTREVPRHNNFPSICGPPAAPPPPPSSSAGLVERVGGADQLHQQVLLGALRTVKLEVSERKAQLIAILVVQQLS
jgi:hypothetical protein